MTGDQVYGPPELQHLLCACLSLDIRPNTLDALRQRLCDAELNWLLLLAVANQHMMSPALLSALSAKGLCDTLPPDVADYLTELRRRNIIRNTTLRIQAMEAVGALNRAGIEPVLLKGAAHLLGCPHQDSAATRIVVGLDILVTPIDELLARAALAGLGYTPMIRQDGHAQHPPHTIDRYSRTGEIGAITLHHSVISYAMRDESPGGGTLLAAEEVRAQGLAVRQAGLAFRIPSPTHRMLHLVLHDQVQEHDHFLGRLNLRHLHDIARLLADGAAPIDWGPILERLSRHGLRAALASHLLAAHDLFAAPFPKHPGPGWWPRLHHRRRLAQWRFPMLRAALELGGAVAWTFARCRYAPVPPGLRGSAVLLGRRARHLVGIARRQRIF